MKEWKCPHCGDEKFGFTAFGNCAVQIHYNPDGNEGSPEHDDYETTYHKCAKCETKLDDQVVDNFLFQ